MPGLLLRKEVRDGMVGYYQRAVELRHHVEMCNLGSACLKSIEDLAYYFCGGLLKDEMAGKG
jgi:hypothetical protein